MNPSHMGKFLVEVVPVTRCKISKRRTQVGIITKLNLMSSVEGGFSDGGTKLKYDAVTLYKSMLQFLV